MVIGACKFICKSTYYYKMRSAASQKQNYLGHIVVALFQLIEIVQESLLVVLAQGDILAIIEEYAPLGIARYSFQIDDI